MLLPTGVVIFHAMSSTGSCLKRPYQWYAFKAKSLISNKPSRSKLGP